MKIFALIPAHNEELSVGNTIESLRDQSKQVDGIYVVSDNSTDSTILMAESHGATVFETVNNTHKKAGALNFALDKLLPLLSPLDAVLIMDADTQISEDFILSASQRIKDGASAVGAVFFGEEPKNLLEQFQYNEYVRYSRTIDINKRVMVLSGTAAVITVRALQDVAHHRGSTLPGELGDVYDKDALTEDNELTFALKTLGHRLESPDTCRSVTELMPTVKDLMNQRIRWYRGALENLPRYGLTKVTWRYWFQQVMLSVTTVMMTLYILLITSSVVFGWVRFSLVWSIIGLVFVVERVVSAHKSNRNGRILSYLILPELIYDVMLMVAFVRGSLNNLAGTDKAWKHVER